jgi:hypothetical protein
MTIVNCQSDKLKTKSPIKRRPIRTQSDMRHPASSVGGKSAKTLNRNVVQVLG